MLYIYMCAVFIYNKNTSGNGRRIGTTENGFGAEIITNTLSAIRTDPRAGPEKRTSNTLYIIDPTIHNNNNNI